MPCGPGNRPGNIKIDEHGFNQRVPKNSGTLLAPRVHVYLGVHHIYIYIYITRRKQQKQSLENTPNCPATPTIYNLRASTEWPLRRQADIHAARLSVGCSHMPESNSDQVSANKVSVHALHAETGQTPCLSMQTTS